MTDLLIECLRASEHEIGETVYRFVRPSTGRTEIYCSFDCAMPGIRFADDERDRAARAEVVKVSSV